MSARIIIGIDPGYTGAFAFGLLGPDASFSLIDVKDMPTTTVKSGRSNKAEVLLSDLASILSPDNMPLALQANVFIERVHAMPGQGVTSMFRFGKVFGNIEGVVAALGLPISYLNPADWQRVAGVRRDPSAGLLRASQLFPTADFFTLKKHHNRADAALIAYAGAVEVLGHLPTTR